MHVSKVKFWDDSKSKQHRQGKQTLKEHWEIASCLNQLINRAVILESTKPSPLCVTVPRSSTRNSCFFYRILTKTGRNKSRKSWENNKRKTALANYQTKSPVLTDFGPKVNCKLLRHKLQVIIWRYLSSLRSRDSSRLHFMLRHAYWKRGYQTWRPRLSRSQLRRPHQANLVSFVRFSWTSTETLQNGKYCSLSEVKYFP